MSNPRLKNTRDIGALIRRRRKDMGIGQAALADKIGVSRAWVIKVERGHPQCANRFSAAPAQLFGRAFKREP